METNNINEVISKILFRVKEERKAKGFSHENMAAELNISPSAYNKIERQNTKLSVERLLQIQNILELSLNEIFNLNLENVYNQKLNDNAVGHQEVKNLYQDNRELTDKFINSLQEEIVFLKGLLNKNNV